MDLNEMLVFTRVVQTGSFSAAAKLLRMPKSTVSRRVSALEDRLGARLIQRTTRKLGLTDEGRIFHAHAARIVAQVEEAEQSVRNVQAQPRGLLRVTAPLSFALLGHIVAEFLALFPDVQVDLTCTDRRVDLVEEGFDVAIRAGKLADSSLVVRPLGTVRRVLVTSRAYAKKKGTPRRPEDLVSHECIAFGAGPTPNTWRLSSAAQTVEVRLNPRLTVNDFDMIRDAALSGLGVAALPEFVCAQDLDDGKLRRVLPGWYAAESPLQALYPTSRHLSPKVVAFIELVRERLNFQ